MFRVLSGKGSDFVANLGIATIIVFVVSWGLFWELRMMFGVAIGVIIYALSLALLKPAD